MLTKLDHDQIQQLKENLMKLVPDDGTSIGNVTLIDKFVRETRKLKIPIKKDDYWEIRNQLIFEGLLEKGRGKGGSVYKIPIEPIQFDKGEAGLYSHFHEMLDNYWVKEYGIEDENYIIEKTARQGRKITGGKWTRPDITLIAIRNYEFVPGKTIEITTFEIKPLDFDDIKGVYETASHHGFANYSYLAIHSSEKKEKTLRFERLVNESKRFGIGLITFSNPSDFKTVEVINEPTKNNPEPSRMNEFIKVQISNSNQEELLKILKGSL